MKLLKAFVAGMIVPSFLLPIFLTIAVVCGKTEVLVMPIVHVLPWIWGAWNVLYFMYFKKVVGGDVSKRYFIVGGMLGFLVACFAVFVLELPMLLDFPKKFYFLPLLIGPVLYAFLWRYLVRPLNTMIGLGRD